jgi:hypothetical protein
VLNKVIQDVHTATIHSMNGMLNEFTNSAIFCNIMPYSTLYKHSTSFNAGALLSLFHHEEGGDMPLRKVGWISTDYQPHIMKIMCHNHCCVIKT